MPVNQEPPGEIRSVLNVNSGIPPSIELSANCAPQQLDSAMRCGVSYPQQQHYAPYVPRSYRPAFWDSKLYGEPYGNFCRGVAKPKKNANQANCPQFFKSEPTLLAAGQLGNADELDKLEQTMRSVLRRSATVHRVERTVLLELFAKALKKRACEPKDTLRPEQFQNAWKLLGVSISRAQAGGIFNKYGQNALGRMPVMMFVNALLAGWPRTAVKGSTSIIKGPLQLQDYHSVELAAGVKIKYPQCRTGVFVPSNWNPELIKRSANQPEKKLELSCVHGYEGRSTTSSNIFFNSDGDLVYYVASVGIVYNQPTRRQRFFLGHNDDILCLAMHPDGATFASGQVAAIETETPSGDKHRADPCLLVWDSTTATEKRRLFHGKGLRGVNCVLFSTSGRTLVSVCMDDVHTMFVWNWEQGLCLLSRNTRAGNLYDVCGAAWSPFSPQQLCTYGSGHIWFWTLKKHSVPDSIKVGQPSKHHSCPFIIKLTARLVITTASSRMIINS